MRHAFCKSIWPLRRRVPVIARVSSLLNDFHRSKADRCIKKWTPIASNNRFAGGFNVSGHLRLFFALADRPSSFWGIDRCLRIWDQTGSHSSHVFRQGVFGQSIDLQRNFKTPWEDGRFHDLQSQILNQFFSLLEFVSIDNKRLQVSYCAGCVLGSHPDGRDRLLKKRYDFPEDRVSRQFLRQRGVRCVGVPELANINTAGLEGTPVGMGLEVFCDDVEIGTILFHCFKIRQGILRPINYVAGYGVGLERLVSVISQGNFLQSVERYALARKILARKVEVAQLSMYERDVLRLLYGLEALAVIPSRVSTTQKRLMQPLKLEVKRLILALGLSFEDVKELFSFFQHWKD